MMKLLNCPECGKRFSSKLNYCGCGWQKQAIAQQTPADHRCEYWSRQRQRHCPLPGTISPHLHGNAKWYCSLHWHALGDAKEGEAKLIYAEEHEQEILAERADWRRQSLINKNKYLHEKLK